MTGAEALIQQSEIQTKRKVLLKLLDIRIGAVPDTVIQRISRMRSNSRLDRILEQVATAQKLDDIEWK